MSARRDMSSSSGDMSYKRDMSGDTSDKHDMYVTCPRHQVICPKNVNCLYSEVNCCIIVYVSRRKQVHSLRRKTRGHNFNLSQLPRFYVLCVSIIDQAPEALEPASPRPSGGVPVLDPPEPPVPPMPAAPKPASPSPSRGVPEPPEPPAPAVMEPDLKGMSPSYRYIFPYSYTTLARGSLVTRSDRLGYILFAE